MVRGREAEGEGIKLCINTARHPISELDEADHVVVAVVVASYSWMRCTTPLQQKTKKKKKSHNKSGWRRRKRRRRGGRSGRGIPVAPTPGVGRKCHE